MKAKPMTERQVRKSNISYLAIVAAMVNRVVNGDGICAVHPYLDTRKGLYWVPGVHMQLWKFMEMFGEDTNYEYVTDKDGDMKVITDVEGVIFYALVSGLDLLENGVLV